jgi:hypothetical protein
MTDTNDVHSATIEKEELTEVNPEDSNLVAEVDAEESSSTLPMVTDVHLEGTSVYVETDEDTITEVGDIVTVAEEGLRTRITDTIGSDFIGDVSRYEASILQNWREDKQAFDLTTASDGEHEHLAIECGELGYVIIEENVDEVTEVSVVNNNIPEELGEDTYEWKQDTDGARRLIYPLFTHHVFESGIYQSNIYGSNIFGSNAGLETSNEDLLTALYDGDVRVEKTDNILAYTARQSERIPDSKMLRIILKPIVYYQFKLGVLFERVYPKLAKSTTNFYLIYPLVLFFHFIMTLGFIANIPMYIGYKLSDKDRLVRVEIDDAESGMVSTHRKQYIRWYLSHVCFNGWMRPRHRRYARRVL